MLDNLIILGSVGLPILCSSTLVSMGSVFGSLATSLISKNSDEENCALDAKEKKGESKKSSHSGVKGKK